MSTDTNSVGDVYFFIICSQPFIVLEKGFSRYKCGFENLSNLLITVICVFVGEQINAISHFSAIILKLFDMTRSL